MPSHEHSHFVKFKALALLQHTSKGDQHLYTLRSEGYILPPRPSWRGCGTPYAPGVCGAAKSIAWCHWAVAHRPAATCRSAKGWIRGSGMCSPATSVPGWLHMIVLKCDMSRVRFTRQAMHTFMQDQGALVVLRIGLPVVGHGVEASYSISACCW